MVLLSVAVTVVVDHTFSCRCLFVLLLLLLFVSCYKVDRVIVL